MSRQTPIVIYTTRWCGDCLRSKSVLMSNDVSYTEIDIETDPQASEKVESLNKGLRVVPTIVFPDKSILSEPSNSELETKLRQLKLV